MTDHTNFFDLIATEKTQRPGNRVRDGVPTSMEHVRVDASSGEPGWNQVKEDAYLAVAMSTRSLPRGCYKALQTTAGMALQKMPIATDDILTLPDSQSIKVVEEITNFKSKAKEFKKRGLLHKRGIMLWGPPGGGKTCTIQLILKLLIEQYQGVALYIEDPRHASECLRLIRFVEPKRQIVAIMEDLDTLVEHYGEAEFLAILDGESQVDNIVYVATTNYPERLDKRFVDRPSRFDTISWVGMPTAPAREMYLRSKEKEWDINELQQIIDATHNYSIAHLREILILIKCLGYKTDDAIKRVISMKVKPSSENDPTRPKVGFANA